MAALTCPCRALAIQAIAVEIPIPNRAAADRADIPLADAAKTRWRGRLVGALLAATLKMTRPDDHAYRRMHFDPMKYSLDEKPVNVVWGRLRHFSLKFAARGFLQE